MEKPKFNICVDDLEKTVSTLKKLGFELLPPPYDTLLTNGSIILHLDIDKTCAPGLIFYAPDIEKNTINLEKLGLQSQKTVNDNELTKATFFDPNGVAIHLIKKITDTTLPPTDKTSPCGHFYEISIETEAFNDTINFWQMFGFSITHGDPKQDAWVTLSDPTLKIGIYKKGTCNHTFHNPALTFFDDHMPKIIDDLKTQHQISFAQELKNDRGIVDHAILQLSGGQHIFLFSP